MDILNVDFNSANAAEQLVESLHTTGFAVLKNHPLPWSDIERSYKEWNKFFNSDAKYKYEFNPQQQDGYLCKTHEHQAANSKIGIKDLKEVFQIYIPWGQYPIELSDLPRKLFYEKFNLGKTLLGWIENHLPQDIKVNLKERLTDIVSQERTLYRAIYYPPLATNEELGAVRAAAHEDFSLLTLLPAATEAGLQVKDNNGVWHDVEVNPQTIIINAGGTLQEASNYFIRSTEHQVVNPEGESANRARLSLPLFLHGRKEAFLSERYPTVGQYFDEKILQLALNKQSAY